MKKICKYVGAQEIPKLQNQKLYLVQKDLCSGCEGNRIECEYYEPVKEDTLKLKVPMSAVSQKELEARLF